ncbi:unnamed protein product [Spirodela intermedia]|uniref:Uncharacterized protein n=1 Tax=Spirodela intermedia TaxID=51605 RepID=A0A7I8IDI8_SPIIN|nr:unnamed protein product [Spirodela intermedia]CAA6655840.1 unnamed protein product [Spirodela intermedia]
MGNRTARRRTRWLRGDANTWEFEGSPFVNGGGGDFRESRKGEAAGGCEPFHSLSSLSRCGLHPWKKGCPCPVLFFLVSSINRQTGLTHLWRKRPIQRVLLWLRTCTAGFPLFLVGLGWVNSRCCEFRHLRLCGRRNQRRGVAETAFRREITSSSGGVEEVGLCFRKHGFWELLVVASMPVMQVILVGLVGAFLAGDFFGVLTADARKHMNRVVYMVFTPSLMFASLAKTITLEDIISWWFMPVNIGLTFVIGGTLGWVVVKLLRPEPHLGGLIIAMCSAGNLGNLMLIVVPAICNENRSPFGETAICRSRGLSYSSFSMALGGFYIWTHTFSLMRNSGEIHRRMVAAGGGSEKDLEAPLLPPSTGPGGEAVAPTNTYSVCLPSSVEPRETEFACSAQTQIPSDVKLLEGKEQRNFLNRLKDSALQLVEELMSPPTAAAVLGFIFGTTPWLKSLIIGAAAPFRVVYDSIKLMGTQLNGTIPCITLILGGNLTKGIRKSKLKRSVILAVLWVKIAVLPALGIAVTQAAAKLGFLPETPSFATYCSCSTMAELFDVAREECSVIFLWTYLLAALSLTVWSSVYLWILS